MDAEDDPETALDRLEARSSNGSQLVSVYVPPERLVDEVIVFLGDEHTEAEEVRSDARKKDVQRALVRLQDQLATYDTPPETGMALFCGRIDGEWVEAILESPPCSVESFRYQCDDAFLTGAFRDLLAESE